MAISNKGDTMRIGMTAALAFALAVAGAAHAQVYRWTDPSGRVHFTDTPPPANARNVLKKRFAASVPDQGPAATTTEPYVLQQARKSAPVTLYTGPRCAPCDSARSLLNKRGVPFKEVSVASEAAAAELKNAVGGNTIPAIVVGTSTQMGFHEGTYNGLLDAAGYPKKGILPPHPPAAGAGVPKEQMSGSSTLVTPPDAPSAPR